MADVPLFEEGEYGPTRGHLAARVPLTYTVMVAALVGADIIGRDDLATPALVRAEVEYQVLARGMNAVRETAAHLAEAHVSTTDPDDEWVWFCRRAVTDMLTAEGVSSGIEALTADELTAGLMVMGDLFAEDLATPDDVRYEITRIAYTRGIDAFRKAAAERFEVNAPAFDVDAHAWPGFCRQAVAGMLAAARPVAA